MVTQRDKINKTLIREAKEEYLDGYHIDLSKYSVEVTYSYSERVTCTNGMIACICFTSKETAQRIYVDSCYYDETGILQADVHF